MLISPPLLLVTIDCCDKASGADIQRIGIRTISRIAELDSKRVFILHIIYAWNHVSVKVYLVQT